MEFTNDIDISSRNKPMIAIVNVTEEPTPTGVNKYEIRINRDVVATFDHVREDGLAECLRKAARAVDAAAEAAGAELDGLVLRLLPSRLRPDGGPDGR